jgi:hypothetical protein
MCIYLQKHMQTPTTYSDQYTQEPHRRTTDKLQEKKMKEKQTNRQTYDA